MTADPPRHPPAGGGSGHDTRLIIWRHGRTEWNADSRVQGQLDVPLDEVGRAQAVVAARRLAALRPGAIVASDLIRAADTAAQLAEASGLIVTSDPRLRERHFGQWQGLTLAEIEITFPTEYARWRSGTPDLGCGIESLDDVGKRVGAALQEVAERAAGSTVVLVSHGGAARYGCAALLGWPLSVVRTIGGLSNCHWIDLRHDDVRGWQLRGYNIG